jgi:hypothetical protein
MARSKKRHFDEEDVPEIIKDLGELRINMLEARENAKSPEEIIGIFDYAFEQLIMILANYIGEVETGMQNVYENAAEYTEECVAQHEEWLHEEDEEEEKPKAALSQVIG